MWYTVSFAAVSPVISGFLAGERAAPSHGLCVPLFLTYLSKSEATEGHFGEKISTWQTVNKGDSGRAEEQEAAGVKPRWLEAQQLKDSLYSKVKHAQIQMSVVPV